MASPTLAQYRIEVRRLLHDATGKFWSNAELNDYINSGRTRVCSDTGCLRRLITVYLSQGIEQYPIGGVTGGIVTAAGSNYSTLSIAVAGDGAGATAVGVLSGTSTVKTGVVTSLTVTNPGSNYTSAPALSFSGGGGSGAAGTVSLFPILNSPVTAGSGYIVGDILTAVGGSPTVPYRIQVANVNGLGAITAYVPLGVPTYPAPLVGVVSFTGGTGSGYTVFLLNWALTSPVVTNPGTGYTSAPAVAIIGGGGSSGAITATLGALTGGAGLASIIVTNPGAGYTNAQFVITGDGVNAAATATVIPATTLDIMNISPFWGNQRTPLAYMPFTEFNARLRSFVTNPQMPAVWSRYGSNGGAAFLGPIPDQTYKAEFDTAILPTDLVNDSDIDVLQFPYAAPVAFYAAYKAKYKQQAYGEVEIFLSDYKRKVLEAQAAIQMRRIPNPYYGYTGAA